MYTRIRSACSEIVARICKHMNRHLKIEVWVESVAVFRAYVRHVVELIRSAAGPEAGHLSGENSHKYLNLGFEEVKGHNVFSYARRRT